MGLKPITLTTQQVCDNALKYYNAKKLTAQHPDAAKALCLNFIGDYRCAVAASYPEEWIGEDALSTYLSGVRDNLIISDSVTTTVNIHTIQYIHDCWAKARRNGESEEIINYMEQRFVKFITPGLE